VPVLERGERIEHLAFGYERAGWKDLAWTAIRSALLAGLFWMAWGSDEELGQAHAVALTNRRLVFVACRGSVGPAEQRRGKLVAQGISAVPRHAFDDDAIAGEASADRVTICIETEALKRRVFFEPAALPENLERSRRMLAALRSPR
jgi:hypothetical protein